MRGEKIERLRQALDLLDRNQGPDDVRRAIREMAAILGPFEGFQDVRDLVRDVDWLVRGKV